MLMCSFGRLKGQALITSRCFVGSGLLERALEERSAAWMLGGLTKWAKYGGCGASRLGPSGDTKEGLGLCFRRTILLRPGLYFSRKQTASSTT